MLNHLSIENIAVIEKAEIDFTKGFNVLTGETGAGKSIVVDSINAVLGERASKELVRHGAENAFVSAVFDGIGNDVKAMLEKVKEIASLGREYYSQRGIAYVKDNFDYRTNVNKYLNVYKSIMER